MEHIKGEKYSTTTTVSSPFIACGAVP